MTQRGAVLLGFGGHGAVVLDCLTVLKMDVLGVVDPAPVAKSGGIPYLGDDGYLSGCQPGSIILANGLGSVGRTIRRADLFGKWKKRGFEFVTLVHPRSIVAGDAELGEGTQVMAGAVIQTHVRLGDNVIVNTSASVDHHCVIGDHVHLAPGVILSGSVSVGEGSHVGTGARVIQNISIGSNCIVGAGVTVLADIPDNTVVSAANRAVWS